jgi:hypothetical protein
MKKTLWILGAVLALSAGVVGTAYAAEGTSPPGPGGPGMVDGEGPLHDLMIQAAADLLGLELADLEARLAAGETVSQIAVDLGMDLRTFRLDWAEARRGVIEQGIADGLVERSQIRRMAGAWARGLGPCAGLGSPSNGAAQGQ